MTRDELAGRLEAWAGFIASGYSCPAAGQVMLEAAQALRECGDERLREALVPFASFADTFVDEEGWNGPMRTTRIVDWFGPSEFRRARAALNPPQTASAPSPAD